MSSIFIFLIGNTEEGLNSNAFSWCRDLTNQTEQWLWDMDEFSLKYRCQTLSSDGLQTVNRRRHDSLAILVRLLILVRLAVPINPPEKRASPDRPGTHDGISSEISPYLKSLNCQGYKRKRQFINSFNVPLTSHFSFVRSPARYFWLEWRCRSVKLQANASELKHCATGFSGMYQYYIYDILRSIRKPFQWGCTKQFISGRASFNTVCSNNVQSPQCSRPDSPEGMRSFHTRKRCGKFTVIRIAENNMRLRERNRRYPRGAPVLFPRGQRKDGAEEGVVRMVMFRIPSRPCQTRWQAKKLRWRREHIPNDRRSCRRVTVEPVGNKEILYFFSSYTKYLFPLWASKGDDGVEGGISAKTLLGFTRKLKVLSQGENGPGFGSTTLSLPQRIESCATAMFSFVQLREHL
ncbi:unnamed protein product [Nesidiocoris tenuis]|uniref:Uncharacterized protein n=1 Tax=Nesidiocoris tenuis TaxID=355587 RepID=A0A6H5H409_9HEMI|nr:unnamed protein product [Nesidiocoris tenuis]